MKAALTIAIGEAGKPGLPALSWVRPLGGLYEKGSRIDKATNLKSSNVEDSRSHPGRNLFHPEALAIDKGLRRGLMVYMECGILDMEECMCGGERRRTEKAPIQSSKDCSNNSELE